MWHDALGRGRCMFHYETFEAHVAESLKAVFAKENTNLAPIPYRSTSVLKLMVFLE